MRYNFSGHYGENHPNTASINKPVFLIRVWEQREYGHVYITPVWIKTLEDDRHVFTHYDNYFSGGEFILNLFSIRAQYTRSDQPREPYAVRIGYRDEDVLSIEELDKASRKIKFLQQIDNGLVRLRVKFGNTINFAQYVMRVAHVMGITKFIVSQNTNGTDFGESYRYLDNVYVPETIERAIANGYIH